MNITKMLFWGSFLTLIPGMLLRIPFGGAGILPIDVFGSCLLLFWLFQIIFIQKKVPQLPFLLPAGLFLLLAFGSWFLGAFNLPFSEQILSFSYLLRFFYGVAFVGVGFTLYGSKNQQQKNDFWHNMGIIVLIITVLGLLQFYFFPNLTSWSQEGGWDPHQGRLFGTWLDPNFLGGFFGFFLPIFTGKGFEARKNAQKNSKNTKKILFWWGTAILMAIALFLTFSRSGYLAAGFGLLFFLFFRKKVLILFGILIMIISVSFNERAQKRLLELSGSIKSVVLQETDEIDPTANLRIESWQKSLTLWHKKPVFGIGYNTYRHYAAQEGIVDESHFNAGGSDSTFITILVTTGVFGFLAFMWFWGSIWLFAFQKWLTAQNVTALGICAGLLSLFIHSFFVNSLLFPFLFASVMASVGVLGKE